MKAIILGATGAVGRDLTEMLLKDDYFGQVDIFVRREVNAVHPKLKVHVVDFDHPENWQDQVHGDVVFSCMGTNRKAAGSKDRQLMVDYTYQYGFAGIAAGHGVPAYILVSSFGADPKSRFFYTRMKGELDDAVLKLPFTRTAIVRPTSLIRKNTDRTIEKISVPLLIFLNKLGLMSGMRPMKTETVARAMVKIAKENLQGIFEARDIRKLVNE